MPIDFHIFPSDCLKKEYNIYSNLSCQQNIYIGSVILEDPYLIEVIYAENLTRISNWIDIIYNASEKIKKFSVDMINYYHWFSSFAYCDDDIIELGECCKKEKLLNDWEAISHKKYSIPLIDTLFDLFGNFFYISSILKLKLINYIMYTNELGINLIELFSVYHYNYAILKSTKYKKYFLLFQELLLNYNLCLLL